MKVYSSALEYIPNLSVLGTLEPLEKFLRGGGGWVLDISSSGHKFESPKSRTFVLFFLLIFVGLYGTSQWCYKNGRPIILKLILNKEG